MSGAGGGPGSIAGDLKRKEGRGRIHASADPGSERSDRAQVPGFLAQVPGFPTSFRSWGPLRILSLGPSPSQSLNTFPPPGVHS